MICMKLSLLIGALSGLIAAFGQAAESESAQTPPKEHAKPSASSSPPASSEEIPLPPPAVTHHSINLQGQAWNYTATAAYAPLKDGAGKVEAHIFYVAYAAEGGKPADKRPVTFAFNGGPGASAIWLHLGALGPRRAGLARDGTALPAHPHLVTNESTWLEFTDLVFVDPVGTGYSRAAKDIEPKRFFEVTQDIRAMGNFMRRYLTDNDRWLSPIFIAGESYGTTRAAGLASYVQKELGMYLSGLILLSSVLNLQAIGFDPGNEIAYVLAIPSYTATAWYHGKLQRDQFGNLDEALETVEQWTMDEYLPALEAGDTLPEAKRRQIIQQLAQFTGLPRAYLETSKLRVSPFRFTMELLRPEGRTLGLLDSRVTAAAPAPAGEDERVDPALVLSTLALVTPWYDYVRKELQFKTDLPYVFLSREANAAWKWGQGGQGYLNVAGKLAEAMALNEHLKVFAGAGYYDLTTSYLSQVHTLNHLGLPPSLRRQLTVRFYPSGHQIYTDLPSLRRLRQEVGAFVQAGALPDDEGDGFK